MLASLKFAMALSRSPTFPIRAIGSSSLSSSENQPDVRQWHEYHKRWEEVRLCSRPRETFKGRANAAEDPAFLLILMFFAQAKNILTGKKVQNCSLCGRFSAITSSRKHLFTFT